MSVLPLTIGLNPSPYTQARRLSGQMLCETLRDQTRPQIDSRKLSPERTTSTRVSRRRDLRMDAF